MIGADFAKKAGYSMEEPKAEEPKEEENLISFDYFKKVELRVAQIIEASAVPKSEKLVKLQVDLGALGQRQIVAGIGKQYRPEELPGKKVALVVNLKPAKLMGETSQGMLLAAVGEGGALELLSVSGSMPNGSSIS